MEVSLRNAKDEKTICRLRRDNYSVGDWSIMVSGTKVWISHQKLGHARTASIEIPKTVFNRLVDRYEQPQKTVRR